MADFLLVETQGRWAGPGADRLVRDARVLAAGGHRVTLLLAQDGVDAVPGLTPALDALLDLGVEVWADAFSLQQRALTHLGLPAGVHATDMPRVAAAILEPDRRVVWH
jgi:hypothetical protein